MVEQSYHNQDGGSWCHRSVKQIWFVLGAFNLHFVVLWLLVTLVCSSCVYLLYLSLTASISTLNYTVI